MTQTVEERLQKKNTEDAPDRILRLNVWACSVITDRHTHAPSFAYDR